MKRLLVLLALIAPLGAPSRLPGQTAAPPPHPAAPAPDVSLDAAEALIGRALFLRGFYTADDLAYDATGNLEAPANPRTDAWTLAGIDVKKVERRGTRLSLEGLRVAIRYNPDSHQFERHPQNDEKMHLLLADPVTAPRTQAALDLIFAQGIDPRLQHAAPASWQHYFNPALPWPPDTLAGQTVYPTLGLPNPARDVTPPAIAHKADARMTPFAEKDKLRGAMQLSLVVDADGVPRRIAIVRPLGYGLEERAIDAVARWRFTPATREGRPVAAATLLNYEFDVR